MVHDLDGRRPQFQARGQRVHGGGHRGELRHEQAAHLRARDEVDQRLGDDGERALAADHEVVQPRLARCGLGGARQGDAGEGVEVVAADAAEDARVAAVDLVAVLGDQLADLAVDGAFKAVCPRLRLPAGLVERGEGGLGAVGEDDRLRKDVVDRLAVDDAARAGGVVAHQAAEVGAAGGGDVGAELQVVVAEDAVEGVEHDAGLDPRDAGGGVDVEDGVEVLAAVEHDAGADGLAGEAGAATARGDGDAHGRGDLDGGDDVLGGARDDDAERLDLVDTGVGGVELARGGVEANLALEVGAEVAGEFVALLVEEVGHEESSAAPGCGRSSAHHSLSVRIAV